MKLPQYIHQFLVALTLSFALTITTALGTAAYQFDWATAAPLELSSSTQAVMMAAMEGRAGAAGKNIQGKAQEARGNIMGSPADRSAGKAKQAEGQARNTVEDAKDSGASLQERVGATAKNIQGKVQETVGNVTGDPQNQTAGKAKQAEGNVRNAIEDVK